MFTTICRQQLVNPNNSGRIRTRRLEIGLLYHMNDISQYIVFEVSVTESLNVKVTFLANWFDLKRETLNFD